MVRISLIVATIMAFPVISSALTISVPAGSSPQYSIEISSNLAWPFHKPEWKRFAQVIAIYRAPRQPSDKPLYIQDALPALEFESAALRTDILDGTNGLWLVYTHRTGLNQPFRTIRKGQLLVLKNQRLETAWEIDLGRRYIETINSAGDNCSSTASFKAHGQTIDVAWKASGIRWDSEIRSTAPFSTEDLMQFELRDGKYETVYPSLPTVTAGTLPELKKVLATLIPVIRRTPCHRDDLWRLHAPTLEQLYKNIGHTVDIGSEGELGTYLIYLSQYLMPEESLQKVAKMYGVKNREEFLAKLIKKNPINAISWDKKRWLSPDSVKGSDNIRYRLFKDLERKRTFLGMTRAQVVELLGPPDRKNDNGMSYRLGLQPGFIRFDDISLHFMLHNEKVIGFSFGKG